MCSTRSRHALRRRPGLGFTLVELAVASMLAVILLLAVVGLLRAVWRQDARTQRVIARHPSTRLLEAQLRQDLINAREFAAGTGRIRLAGFLSTDRVTHLPSWRRAEVLYQIVGSTQRPLLVRHEFGIDVPEDRKVGEIVWVGAAAIDVLTSVAVPDGAEGEPPLRGLMPMPRQLRVIVRDAAGQMICTESVIHREG